MRGWLHGAMFPVSVFAGVILVATSPDRPSRISSAIFATTAVFCSVSAPCSISDHGPLALKGDFVGSTTPTST
jgi:hypothetical protein